MSQKNRYDLCQKNQRFGVVVVVLRTLYPQSAVLKTRENFALVLRALYPEIQVALSRSKHCRLYENLVNIFLLIYERDALFVPLFTT